MKEKIIPILFREYLSGRMFDYDFEDYERNSSPDVQRSLLDGLSRINANAFFEGTASRIHESSHRDVFYYHHIACNFLHIAIQLNDIYYVEKLLNEYNVNPVAPMLYTYSKEQTDNQNDTDRESKKEEETITISPTSLAKDNPEILALLNAAIQRKSKSTAITDALENAEEQASAAYELDYDADSDEKEQKKIKYKKRLILGDGNLSYSRALLAKQKTKGYDEFSHALTVTEYSTEEQLQQKYPLPETLNSFKNFRSNVDALRESGAEVIFGVDATNIHTMFNDRRFRRIHFNFPYYYDDNLTPQEKKEMTRNLVGRFFASAAEIQQPGDRIHMALATGFRDPVWYEDATYGVGEFCEVHGYAYIKKRKFIDPIKSRYAGYGHVKTSDSTAVTTAKEGREFIFEKKIPRKNYEGSSQKKFTSSRESRSVLKSIGTDSDSSSYVEHSDYEGKDMASIGKIPDSAIKAKGSMSNRVGQEIKFGYTILHVTGDGNCGYTALGMSRQQALKLLIDNARDVVGLLEFPTQQALLTEEFYWHLRNQNIIDDDVTHESITGDQEIRNGYATWDKVQEAYIHYDVRDTRIDAGYAHPKVLQALAHIQGINLYMWQLGDNEVLIPFVLGQENYALYRPENATSRTDLLYVNGNHFERLDLSSYNDQIPGENIYPLDSSWSQAKAPPVATKLTLGGTISIRDKTKASKEEALAVTDSSFKRK